MLRWLIFACVCSVCLWVGTSFAQTQVPQPNPVMLRVQVRYDRDNVKVQYAQVELMDSVGGSSVTDKQQTDTDGQVEFRTLTGKHLVRITGDDLVTWEGELEIQLNERSHFEQIRVVRRKSGETAAGPSQPVSTVRLNIPGSARKQYESGLKALQKQEWDEAKKRFEAAIAAYGNYDSAYNGLGVAQMGLNDTESARTSFTHAIDLNPAYGEALRNLARLYLQEKRLEEVVPLLTRSLNTEPTNAWAMVNLANVDLQLKKFDDAVLWGRKVHDLPPPEDPTGHFIAGCALKALGQNSEALAQFDQYLKEDPGGSNSARARDYLALLKAAK